MAENSSVEPSDHEPEEEWRGDRPLDTAEDTLVAMETLLATLKTFEDVLRQQDISSVSSTEYCDNFCQALMHYAGSRNSVEHGLPLLEVYCLSINCFAAARNHLTPESDSVALVLKRLALSCFELLLSVPENDIPYEAWDQFHHAVQLAHDNLLHYGSTDLQALLQITGEGGAWCNQVLTALFTGQHISPEEVDAYISLEGEGFMEMRVKHLEKMGEVTKAVVLAKACTDCCLISNQATFRHTYVSLLCHLLPSEEAITEISRLDCKDVLEITCNMETEGEENTAFILCTTFLTQQLQQQSLYSSWELTLLWSKLQRRIDPSSESLLERCLQLGAIAKTVDHLLYLVRVIRTEAEDLGLASSVELCVKALQLPKQNDSDTRISVCKTVCGLLPGDLEVLRACQLTVFLLGPCQEIFGCLEELYLRPDQKYDQENGIIPNSLRCELLLALKAYWPFDPEFWDWKTLKYHCISLLGLVPESEGEEEEGGVESLTGVKHEPLQQTQEIVEPEHQKELCCNIDDQNDNMDVKKESSDKAESLGESHQTKKMKLYCRLCKKLVSEKQILTHSRRHEKDNGHKCPVCMARFPSRKELVPHLKQHMQNPVKNSTNDGKKKKDLQKQMEEDDIEPGEITIDPSVMLYYQSTHDPDVLQHLVQQTKNVHLKPVDDDEHVTFDYIHSHFNLQNRDEYPCPGTHCTKIFKHSKYLSIHLKSEHKEDDNVKHFLEMRDKREKCAFCRRHFMSAYHHRKHRRVHNSDKPYMCVVIGCGAQFESSNELVTHKQTHGYQLNYQCELKGCYVTLADLGQMYHHEAQHFRDAAFNCTSPECNRFYLSKKELIQHLATHSIVFSEDDFEKQRAKQKLPQTVTEMPSSKKCVDSKTEELVNGDNLTSHSTSCASSSQSSSSKEPKGMITSVAVCFDGSKFTCGFEKCGMTFSRARDVQRHLKCAHPEHLKLENKEHKHDKERGSKSKKINSGTPLNTEEKVKYDLANPIPSTEAGKERKVTPHLGLNETSNLAHTDTLREILTGLSKLDLNSSTCHNGPCEPSTSENNVSQDSLHQAIMANSPVVLLPKKPPHVGEERVNLKSEQASENGKINNVELPGTRPYVCEFQDCDFKTGLSYSLSRHYNMVHGRTRKQAKEMTSFKTTSFRPFVCQICSKTHRAMRALKDHYIKVHNLNKATVGIVDNVSVKIDRSKTTEPRSKTTEPTMHTSLSLVKDRLKVKKKEVPSYQQSYKIRRPSVTGRENVKNVDNPAVEEGEDEAEVGDGEQGSGDGSEQKVENEDGTSYQGRATRRLVSKGNLCYILSKFNKPFHCVVKDCDAAFSNQGGLVRHLQSVHHYNRSQLLLENDLDVHPTSEERKDPGKKRPVLHSDEPQPQYKCHFANCNASYHLKSSLVRHTRDFHCQPPEPLRCKYEGCMRVFINANALKKHLLYSPNCGYYDSLVLRLQSTHKKSISGCQKKLIVAPPSPQKEEPPLDSPESEKDAHSEVTCEEDVEEKKIDIPSIKPKSKRDLKKRYDCFIYRSHEEALQMCQDPSMIYPCMVQDCDSVVKYVRSIQRHYESVHRMHKDYFSQNEDKLVITAEQLEELIQRKSARSTSTATCAPNGVRKMEYQAEPDKPGGLPTPMSLHSINTDTLAKNNHETLGFPEEEPLPVERNNVLVGADDVLYGEPSTGGHNEEPAATTQNGLFREERPRRQKSNMPLPADTVDLSPPSSLRITIDECFQGASVSKDGSNVPNPPVRQPLKRKNEMSEQSSNQKDAQPHCPPPRTFDIATYKPIGFESSFLEFIQETSPMDKEMTSLKKRDSFRRGFSVKENNRLGITLNRSKCTRPPLVKPLAMTGDFTSVQNLKSILDKALAGCGDLAIKQLQYLRPVVVLERPVVGPDRPGVVMERPVVVMERPVVVMERPVVVLERSVVVLERPVCSLPDVFPSDSNSSKLLFGNNLH